MATSNAELEAFRFQWVNELETRQLLPPTRDEPGEVRDREISIASTHTMPSKSQTRESTATVRDTSQMPDLHQQEEQYNTEDRMDIDSAENTTVDEEPNGPVILATDFGTTFSAAAYIQKDSVDSQYGIKMIANYPDDPRSLTGKPGLEVPTESWYPDRSHSFAAGLDHDMENTEDPLIEDLYGVSDDEGNQSPDDEPLDEDAGLPDYGIQEEFDDFRSFVWGFGIERETAADMDYSKFNRITRSKLLLDSSEHTTQVREELRPVLNRLMRLRIIGKSEDVIADYLTSFLQHAKKELISKGVVNTDLVEHVLTVPIVWSPKALRTMQRAMETAIRESKLGSISNLFLVSEPEAAAAFVLSKTNKVNEGEAFVLLDAGGGTVDATTYTVDKSSPLRLSKELVPSDGCLHGSSYLNEGYRNHLLERLTPEADYLERDGYTIKGMVDVATLAFENKSKRTLDITNPRLPLEIVPFQGLRADREKRFTANRLQMNRNDFVLIYSPHLNAIAQLMKRQLAAAKAAGHRVQKVVIVGGFSGSPSLRNHLKQELKMLSRGYGYVIRLIDAVDTEAPETAVAHGAALRALDKTDGPKRITKSSYGFLRMEEHWPEKYEAHRGIRPSIDKLDGLRYIKNTIEWLVVKDMEIDNYAEFTIPASHTFPVARKTFKCEEILYVSDTCKESHYRRNHPNNRTAEEAGRIVIDMAPLVQEGRVQVENPKPGFVGQPHYKFEFDLVIMINGRNLTFEARWPAREPTEVKVGGQVSIAAAFQPGTE